MRVAALGDTCIDIYPEINARYYVTGNAVDFAVNISRLGANASLISAAGTDDFGKEVLATLNRDRIDLSHFKTIQGKTAVTHVVLNGTERIHTGYEEGVMKTILYTDEDIRFAASHDLVHTTLLSNAVEDLPKLKKLGALTSMDYATEGFSSFLDETINYIDYAFFSFDNRCKEVEQLLRNVTQRGASIATATFGEKGSLSYDGNHYYEGGIKHTLVVNTIGAGDAYIAGFMYGVLLGLPINKCQTIGAECASDVIAVFEAWTGYNRN